MNHKYKISFVVDNLALHYYQAELLLYSLEQFAEISKEDVLVHCLDRVDSDFLNFLLQNGYNYKIIEPYLDGKYCNKLQQLESFKNVEDVDGIMLLDTDMFVLKPFEMPNNDLISGKIVDGPNPSMKTLSKIFKEANLKFPKIVSTDFDKSNNDTFDCYFNGGFYYIPAKHIKDVSSEWRKWASWLYDRSNLFETKQQAIHADQVSMAMAITSCCFEYQKLDSNYNCAIHRGYEQKYLTENNDIKLLHYHQEFSPFGFIDAKNISSNVQIKNAIDKANNVILEKKDFIYFEGWKKSKIVNYGELENKSANEKINKLDQSDLPTGFKIVLHAGTPKTGTTSLQSFLYVNSKVLKEAGYVYPDNVSSNNDPKHQWIVSTLRSDDFDGFMKEFQVSIDQAINENCNLILSTEGIFNHWWDFSPEAKVFLFTLVKQFKIKLWVFFREPFSFAKSLYKQNLINHQTSGIDCFGKDLTLLEMLEDPWFQQHLDYLGFILECEKIFNQKNISVFSYTENTISDFCNILEIEAPVENAKQENIGLSDAGIELIKVINRYDLNINDKKKVYFLIKDIDNILGRTLENNFNCNDMKNIINQWTARGLRILHSKYEF